MQKVDALTGKRLPGNYLPWHMEEALEGDILEEQPSPIARSYTTLTTTESSPPFKHQGLSLHAALVDLSERKPGQIARTFTLGLEPPKSIEFLNILSIDASSLAVFNFNATDPSTQQDLVEHNEDLAQRYIFLIRAAGFSNSEHVANRLAELSRLAKEEDSENQGISISSLRNFYTYLQLRPDLKKPIITLTPANDIYASWKGSQGRIFSVHFLPSSDVRFSVVKPNNKHPEQQARISGITTADMLEETVTPYEVFDWDAE